VKPTSYGIQVVDLTYENRDWATRAEKKRVRKKKTAKNTFYETLTDSLPPKLPTPEELLDG
jgi:hypothetical protein